MWRRLVTRSAIRTASVSAVEPSYMEALATSWPVICAHQSLKLENGGERALREFGLVRRVGGEEFTALEQRIGGDGAQVLVYARAEKRNVAASIFRGARLEILNDLGFGERAGKIQRSA